VPRLNLEKASQATPKRWGESPWTIDFRSQSGSLPSSIDFAIVGAGFTGLSCAARLAKLAPKRSVAVFEAEGIGAGSSGHTGGLALAETAAGDMPGLGDVLAGLEGIVRDLNIDCDLALPGVWELGRTSGESDSSMCWSDSGDLRVAKEVPGGTIDPGKLVSGLARAAVSYGARIFEEANVKNVDFGEPLTLTVRGERIAAQRVLVATNAESLELNALKAHAQPKFTLALATAPLADAQLKAVGLSAGKPFYTVDLPYLWGRLFHGNRVIFGSGLVHLNDWRDLLTLDVTSGEAARLMQNLENRVRALHPALRDITITHRWGGPILISNDWKPAFACHPQSDRVLVLGAYTGHGVALSVYLGSWAAEVMLQRRELPNWDTL
jgi:glycine/D-amino acid oxidase-like deaminating enzyme